MNSVPEQEAEWSAHPAAVEAAASLREVALGVRPQWAALPPVPSRPLRVPSHNARVAAFLAFRQSQSAAQGRQLIVAEPHRMAFRSLLGARRVPYGYALNLEYVYQSPRLPRSGEVSASPRGGCAYVIIGHVWGYEDGPLTGKGYARSCTCPDFQKRQGVARDQIQGEERCCKHMRLFLALAHLWQGQIPWVGVVPAYYQKPGDGFTLREF